MADIVVVHLSEDTKVVERLVVMLRTRWTVWSSQDIVHGDWEEAVRMAIRDCSVLVPVLSAHAKGSRKTILKDEMRFAHGLNIPIISFVIGAAEIPLGLGDLDRIDAYGWSGDERDEGLQRLISKLGATFASANREIDHRSRVRELQLGAKRLTVPGFVFSLSSHETQVSPSEGARLLSFLEPNAVLISAYDAWKSATTGGRDDLEPAIRGLRQSKSALILDSGNYEAWRKHDRHSPQANPGGWNRDRFHETAIRVAPDLAFAFDTVDPTGTAGEVANAIAEEFRVDEDALGKRSYLLVPIVHLPVDHKAPVAKCAAEVTSRVVSALDPPMVAIPERELGDGLRERALTVRAIRLALNATGKYYPLHLLGTGNPLTMYALAAAGADAFDGLEWCRTVADYERGVLFHFQQFDFFAQTQFHRVRDQRVRDLLENPNATYATRVLSYNIDFYNDWARTMYELLHAGQAETLLRLVPGIGTTLFNDLAT